VKALTIFSLVLASLLFSAGASPLSANIDPAHEQGIERLAPGVYARESAAIRIQLLNETQFQEVIDLFRNRQPPKKGRGFSDAENDCFALQIKTERSFEDLRIKEKDFPDMKTEKGISVIEFFFVNEDCARK